MIPTTRLWDLLRSPQDPSTAPGRSAPAGSDVFPIVHTPYEYYEVLLIS
jgi:hypothetical protein